MFSTRRRLRNAEKHIAQLADLIDEVGGDLTAAEDDILDLHTLTLRAITGEQDKRIAELEDELAETQMRWRIDVMRLGLYAAALAFDPSTQQEVASDAETVAFDASIWLEQTLEVDPVTVLRASEKVLAAIERSENPDPDDDPLTELGEYLGREPETFTDGEREFIASVLCGCRDPREHDDRGEDEDELPRQGSAIFLPAGTSATITVGPRGEQSIGGESTYGAGHVRVLS